MEEGINYTLGLSLAELEQRVAEQRAREEKEKLIIRHVLASDLFTSCAKIQLEFEMDFIGYAPSRLFGVYQFSGSLPSDQNTFSAAIVKQARTLELNIFKVLSPIVRDRIALNTRNPITVEQWIKDLNETA